MKEVRDMKIEVGSKVKIICGYEGQFNGRIATVTEVDDDLYIMATSKEGLMKHESEGDDFHLFFLSGEYEPILTIQPGKYYRTRDGRKVGPMAHDEANWYTCGDGRLWSEEGERWSPEEYHNNIIAEWTGTTETGTLAELNVKPGDVVEWFNTSVVNPMEVISASIITSGAFEGQVEAVLSGYGSGIFSVEQFRIISRASDTPKTWGEMTDAEKRAVALAFVQGRTVQCWQDGDTPEYWADIPDPNWNDDCKFRIKPEPKRETVTLCGSDIRLKPFIAGHRITFETIDGKPDLGSIKMEALG
jgi:hypothetical protein